MNRFAAFTLGVIVTAVSIGAVNFASAAGDVTIKTCANKKTGVMRYISKGSCKKTEKTLSWNQMGPQGQAGATGAAGVDGGRGATGSAGVNGQNIHVVDAMGRDLGVTLSADSTSATIIHEAGIWLVSNTVGPEAIRGNLVVADKYTDSSCTKIMWVAPSSSALVIPSARGSFTISGSTKYYKTSGSPYLGSANMVIYARYGSPVNGIWQCIQLLAPAYSWDLDNHSKTYYTDVAEVTPPALTTPFTLVAK